nr:uncharacterized protein C20orf173 homolog [Manis javanica]
MKRLWPIFVLWVFWTLIFWLMASCLDMKPALAPQEKLMYLVPWCCNCPWSKFRKCGCPSGTLNDSSCHHMVREQNWFGARYEKAMGSFTGARESMISDTGFDGGSVVNTAPSPIPCPSQAQPISHFPSPNPWLSASPILTASTPDLQMEASPTQGKYSASKLGKVWEELFKVIPRSSVSHFDPCCRTCALVGNSKILQGLGLGNIVNHHTTAFRKANAQGSWRQFVLLMLRLSGLAWTSDALSEEI